MLRHIKCGGIIRADVTESIYLHGSFLYSRQGIVLRKLNVDWKKTKIVPKYICTDCNKVVETSEMEEICNHCGEWFPLEELRIPSNNSCTYCLQHVNELFSAPYFNVLTILNKING
jgi:DNA-directed RNA polymerase subunit RPC12/RpoP